METYSSVVDVFGSPPIDPGHDEANIADFSGAGSGVLNRGRFLNLARDVSLAEFTENKRSQPMRFDFALSHNTLANARASMSIAIVDPPTTPFSSVDNTTTAAPQLIANNVVLESTWSSQSLTIPNEGMDSQFSFGRDFDKIILNDVLVPEPAMVYYSLLGIGLLLAKFQWDARMKRRIDFDRLISGAKSPTARRTASMPTAS